MRSFRFMSIVTPLSLALSVSLSLISFVRGMDVLPIIHLPPHVVCLPLFFFNSILIAAWLSERPAGRAMNTLARVLAGLLNGTIATIVFFGLSALAFAHETGESGLALIVVIIPAGAVLGLIAAFVGSPSRENECPVTVPSDRIGTRYMFAQLSAPLAGYGGCYLAAGLLEKTSVIGQFSSTGPIADQFFFILAMLIAVFVSMWLWGKLLVLARILTRAEAKGYPFMTAEK